MWTTAKRLEGSVEPPPPPQHRLAAASSHWSTSNCGRKGRISHSAHFSLEEICSESERSEITCIIPYLRIMEYRRTPAFLPLTSGTPISHLQSTVPIYVACGAYRLLPYCQRVSKSYRVTHFHTVLNNVGCGCGSTS